MFYFIIIIVKVGPYNHHPILGNQILERKFGKYKTFFGILGLHCSEFYLGLMMHNLCGHVYWPHFLSNMGRVIGEQVHRLITLLRHKTYV